MIAFGGYLRSSLTSGATLLMAEGVGLIERNASPRTWQMIGEGYNIWWKCLLN